MGRRKPRASQGLEALGGGALVVFDVFLDERDLALRQVRGGDVARPAPRRAVDHHGGARGLTVAEEAHAPRRSPFRPEGALREPLFAASLNVIDLLRAPSHARATSRSGHQAHHAEHRVLHPAHRPWVPHAIRARQRQRDRAARTRDV